MKKYMTMVEEHLRKYDIDIDREKSRKIFEDTIALLDEILLIFSNNELVHINKQIKRKMFQHPNSSSKNITI